MASTILLDQFRKKLAAHMAGKNTLSPLSAMAFGDGGHDLETHMPLDVDQTSTVLQNELLRKSLSKIDQEDEFCVFGTGIVEKNEIVNKDISEVALCDSSGDLLSIHHLRPKHKESDEKYIFTGTIRF